MQGRRSAVDRLPWIRRCTVAAASLLLAATVTAVPAQAAIISLTPSSDTIQVGGSFDLDVVVSDLPDGEIVSGFDLDLLFDPALLSFGGISFGTGFGSTDDYIADFFDLGSVVDFFLYNWAQSDNELFALQGGGPVRLATLTFTGIAAGVASLAIDADDFWLDVGGRDGLPLSIGQFGAARIVVEEGSVTVPEPGTLALLTIGLGLLGYRRRRLAAA